MALYIVRRLLWAALVILVVLMIVFAVFYLLPASDPALRFAGKSPTPESLALIRDRLGLDQPWRKQYAIFVKNFVAGDEYGWPGLGDRSTSNVPVLSEVTERAPRTLFLIAGAAIIWLVVGVSIGVLSASSVNRRPTGLQWVSRSSESRAGFLARALGALGLLEEARLDRGNGLRPAHGSPTRFSRI